jgi:hypothetical protein
MDVDCIGFIPVRLFRMTSIFGEFGPKVKVGKAGEGNRGLRGWHG